MPVLSLSLNAVDAEGRPLVDPDTFVRLAAANHGSASVERIVLRGGPVDVWFPDGPATTAPLLRLSPSRHREIQVACTARGGVVTTPGPLRMSRRPAEWTPTFTQWASLSSCFDPLKNALHISPRFRLGRASAAELLVEDRYDAVPAFDESRALAKQELLNLYSRLRHERPAPDAPVWFAFVEELLVASREHLVAVVDEACLAHVQRLAAERHRYRSSTARQLTVAQLPGVADVESALAIRACGDELCLDLAAARVRWRGAPAVLLEVRLDRRGRTFARAFPHTFDTVGTQPTDHHELLRSVDPGLDLGYRLEPRVSAVHSVRPVTAPARDMFMGRGDEDENAIWSVAVLGDGVAAGQGLLSSHKIHSLVAASLGSADQPPGVTSVAHPGAVIGAQRIAAVGNAAGSSPSILQQCDEFPADQAGTVDLVVLSGGLGDVGLETLLDPRMSRHELQELVSRTFGPDLLVLLRRAGARFPNARIAVLEYYRLLSTYSDPVVASAWIAGSFGSREDRSAASAHVTTSWSRVLDNCALFHAASAAAIRRTVAELNDAESADRFVSIDAGLRDEHAAFAPQSWLFEGNADNESEAATGYPNAIGARAYARAIVEAWPRSSAGMLTRPA
jgi:hypothetical protein